MLREFGRRSARNAVLLHHQYAQRYYLSNTCKFAVVHFALIRSSSSAVIVQNFQVKDIIIFNHLEDPFNSLFQVT